jgi:hypothetical protein
MAILRNAANAVIDEGKIRDYALDMDSADGRHKARAIQAATGLTRENHREVIDQIGQAILVSEAEPIEPIPHGLRFRVAMTISGPVGSLRVRTAWIYRSGEDVPRLLTLYPPPLGPSAATHRGASSCCKWSTRVGLARTWACARVTPAPS